MSTPDGAAAAAGNSLPATRARPLAPGRRLARPVISVAFAVVDTGEVGPWGTRAISPIDRQERQPFNNYGVSITATTPNNSRWRRGASSRSRPLHPESQKSSSARADCNDIAVPTAFAERANASKHLIRARPLQRSPGQSMPPTMRSEVDAATTRRIRQHRINSRFSGRETPDGDPSYQK